MTIYDCFQSFNELDLLKIRRCDKVFKRSANVLYNWKKKYVNDGGKAFVGKEHLPDLSAFCKQLRVVTMGRDIFKKAEAKQVIFKYIEMYYNTKRTPYFHFSCKNYFKSFMN